MNTRPSTLQHEKLLSDIMELCNEFIQERSAEVGHNRDNVVELFNVLAAAVSITISATHDELHASQVFLKIFAQQLDKFTGLSTHMDTIEMEKEHGAGPG